MEADTSCEETAAEDEETVGQDTAEHRRPHDTELSLDEGEDRCVWGRRRQLGLRALEKAEETDR